MLIYQDAKEEMMAEIKGGNKKAKCLIGTGAGAGDGAGGENNFKVKKKHSV